MKWCWAKQMSKSCLWKSDVPTRHPSVKTHPVKFGPTPSTCQNRNLQIPCLSRQPLRVKLTCGRGHLYRSGLVTRPLTIAVLWALFMVRLFQCMDDPMLLHFGNLRLHRSFFKCCHAFRCLVSSLLTVSLQVLCDNLVSLYVSHTLQNSSRHDIAHIHSNTINAKRSKRNFDTDLIPVSFIQIPSCSFSGTKLGSSS